MTTITSTEAGATGRYINLGSPASQDAIGAQTIIVYCNPTTGGGEAAAGYLIGKTPSASPNGLRMWVAAATSPTLGFGSHSTNAAAPSGNSAVGSVTFGAWQHLETRWDGVVSDANLNLYINGTLSTKSFTAAGAGSIVSDAADDLFLLNRGNSASLGRAFIGSVAYIARWNRVLSDAESLEARTNGPLNVPTGLILCWANNQDYSTNALTPVARSTFVAGATPPNTALGGSADTTAPTLTSPTGTATGATTASGTVSIDEANGTLHWMASINATEVLATVKAGSSQAVSATGSQAVTVTGLTASTAYYLHYAHTDAAANDSAVVNSASFTTAASDTTAPTLTLPTGTKTGATTATQPP